MPIKDVEQSERSAAKLEKAIALLTLGKDFKTAGQVREQLSMMYFDMALRLAKDGKNGMPYRRKGVLQQLLKVKEKGTKKVIIISAASDGRTCSACRRLNNKVLDIDEAIKQMPAPNKCRSHLLSKKHYWCRCVYTEYYK